MTATIERKNDEQVYDDFWVETETITLSPTGNPSDQLAVTAKAFHDSSNLGDHVAMNVHIERSGRASANCFNLGDGHTDDGSDLFALTVGPMTVFFSEEQFAAVREAVANPK